MSLKSLMNGVAVATIAAGTLSAAAGSAQARDWGRGGGEAHHERHGGGGINRWGEVRSEGHGYGRGAFAHGGDWREEHHARDHTARNVAIGAFAAVLGLALAAESQRVREQYYDEQD